MHSLRSYIIAFLGIFGLLLLGLWLGIDRTKPWIEINDLTHFENTYQSHTKDITLMRGRTDNKVKHFLLVDGSYTVMIQGELYEQGLHHLDLGNVNGYVELTYESESQTHAYHFFYSEEASNYTSIHWVSINPYHNFYSTLLLFLGITALVLSIHALIQHKTAFFSSSEGLNAKQKRAHRLGLVLLGMFYLVIPMVFYALFTLYALSFIGLHVANWKNKIRSSFLFLGILLCSLGAFLLGIIWFIDEAKTEYVALSTEVNPLLLPKYRAIIEDTALYNEHVHAYHEDEFFTFLMVEGHTKFAYSSDGQTLWPELYFIFLSASSTPVFVEIFTGTDRLATVDLSIKNTVSYLFDQAETGEISLFIRRKTDNVLLYESDSFSITPLTDVPSLNKGGQYMENEGAYFLTFVLISHGANAVLGIGLYLAKKPLFKYSRKSFNLRSLYHDSFFKGGI